MKNVPPLLLGVPTELVEYKDEKYTTWESEMEYDGSSLLLSQPSKTMTRIRLPASLLEKSIRRGSGICSSAPLVEACTELLHPTKAYPGSTFAFLKTLWGCMLVDSSPFAESHDCLGLTSILLLSLIAKADPTWVMPRSLRRLVSGQVS